MTYMRETRTFEAFGEITWSPSSAISAARPAEVIWYYFSGVLVSVRGTQDPAGVVLKEMGAPHWTQWLIDGKW
jgi:hypothetical protein